jgi:hypothetical protein
LGQGASEAQGKEQVISVRRRAAIVAINRDGEEYAITPLFVSVMGGMVLTDHEGRAPEGNTVI